MSKGIVAIADKASFIYDTPEGKIFSAESAEDRRTHIIVRQELIGYAKIPTEFLPEYSYTALKKSDCLIPASCHE